jgi:hypothetical protein
MIRFFIVVLLAFTAVAFSFNNDSLLSTHDLAKKDDDTSRYIFLGHIYRYNFSGPGYRVDQRIEDLHYSPYARIWLGGDVLSEATLDRANFIYLDSIFQLSLPSTQYAMGNHDVRNGNIQYYREFTGRESYNVFAENGVVSICINTQLNPSMCEDLNNQFDLIKNVCDTISVSKHLFLLMHNCVFGNVPNIPNVSSFAHSNFENWYANCNSSTQTFYTAIYPLLQQAKSNGVTVYCIMGDTGVNSKEFYVEAEDSIHFFASGISNSRITDSLELSLEPKDKILEFQYIQPTQEMLWNFRDLDSLIEAQ